MSNEDIIKFINQVSKDYSKFNFKENEYEMWKNILKNIPYDVATERYEKHKSDEKFNKFPPDIKLFVYKPQEEKKQNEDFIVACRWCNKKMPLSTIHEHEARHLSVKYIESRMLKYIHKQLSKEQIQQFMELEEDKFQEWYDDFLEKLIPLVENSEEKERLKKIKETRYN